MAGRGSFFVEVQCRPAMISKKELELRQSECSTPEKIVERDQKTNPCSKITYADTYSLSPSSLEVGFHVSSTKSRLGETEKTRTRFDERTDEKVLNKGDLIEFRPYNSFTILYPPYSETDNRESIEHKDVGGTANSHWAVYIGSETITGPNTPYYVEEMREIFFTEQKSNTLKCVYTTKEQDNNTDELKSIVRMGELFHVAKVQIAERYQIMGGTVYGRTRLDDRTDEHVLNKGDLIEFRPYHSILRKYPPYSHHDNKESLVHKDVDGKALSHWAVYLGPNTPYYGNVMTEVPLPNERNMILIIRYPKEEYDRGTDMESKTIVRIDELFQIANVQNAQPYQNNQKDEMRILQAFYPKKIQDSNTYLNLKDVDELETGEWIYELPQVPKVQIAEPYQDNQMNEISKLKTVYPTKEQDKDTDIKLMDSDKLKTIVRTDDPEVQIAEPYPSNQMDEMFNSTKSSVGRTVNTRTRLDERTYEKVLNKGDLIEFRPYNSFTIQYPPYSDPDNKKCIEHKDVGGKAKSHWAVYLGSGIVAHVAGPNMPYCIRVLRDIPTTKQRLCLLNAVYPTKEQDKNTYLKLKKSDDLRPIVRIDDLFQVAKVQNAVPYQNSQMDEMFIAGTPTEIVNIAKHLVGVALPHDFITKDCKDFAVFCRYGENLRSLKETQQHEQLMNKIMCIGILAVMIAFVALKLL